MPRTRTFIAIELSRNIRERLIALQTELVHLPDVKWVEPENLHVTLLFLGEVELRETAAVCRTVQEALTEMPELALTVAGVGCFPNSRRPRVLWAGIADGAPEVVAIHDALEGPLLDLGCYRREERKYTPHITLGRLRGDDASGTVAAALRDHEKWHGGEMTVRAIHVMCSQLSAHGPSYIVLGRANLQDQA